MIWVLILLPSGPNCFPVGSGRPLVYGLECYYTSHNDLIVVLGPVAAVYIVSYFFNVDFLWQDLGARDMVLRDPVKICPIFENETPNFRGR